MLVNGSGGRQDCTLTGKSPEMTCSVEKSGLSSKMLIKSPDLVRIPFKKWSGKGPILTSQGPISYLGVLKKEKKVDLRKQWPLKFFGNTFTEGYTTELFVNPLSIQIRIDRRLLSIR